MIHKNKDLFPLPESLTVTDAWIRYIHPLTDRVLDALLDGGVDWDGDTRDWICDQIGEALTAFEQYHGLFYVGPDAMDVLVKKIVADVTEQLS